jgi:hypothetical protein
MPAMVPSFHNGRADAIERSNGAHHKVEEEALRVPVPLAIAAVLCVFGGAQGQAQETACGGDYVCVTEVPTIGVTQPVGLVGPYRCPGMPVDVTATSPEERRLACSAAGDAIQLLDRCRIPLRKPLQVQIMSEVRHPLGGSIFGLFDTKRERVLIAQEGNIPALVKDTPYAMLPQREFYRSLIVHEVVHGVMHQNLKRPATTHAAYEYPAYALQTESLAPNVRDALLKSFDQAAIASKSLFNDTVLFFDPYFFAVSAYHHFKGSANGCAHLTALLDGEVAFIAPPQM